MFWGVWWGGLLEKGIHSKCAKISCLKFKYLNDSGLGIVHSDLKATNILVWIKDIKTKIIDFGIAHSLDFSL